jgi:hypothetical protein
MMQKLYLLLGTLLVAFSSYASHIGWRPFADLFTDDSWDPREASLGPSYHK